MTFDVEGARNSGYSDDEITVYLASKHRFDYEGAKKSGYNPTEVLEYLTKETSDSWGKTVGKGVMQGALAIPKIVSEGGHVIRQAFDMPESDFRKTVKEAEEYWKPQVEEGSAKSIVGQSARTLSEMATSGAVGKAKGILPLLSAYSGTEKAASMLDENQPMYKALAGGLTQAGIEYATEKIPLDVLMKPGITFLGRLAKGLVYDVPGELLATAGEMAVVDTAIGGKSYTKEQYAQALWDTAKVSGLTTGVATTAVHPFVKSPVEIKEKPETKIVTLTPVEDILKEGEEVKKGYQEKKKAEAKGQAEKDRVTSQIDEALEKGETLRQAQGDIGQVKNLGEVVGYNAADGKPIVRIEKREKAISTLGEELKNRQPDVYETLRQAQGDIKGVMSDVNEKGQRETLLTKEKGQEEGTDLPPPDIKPQIAGEPVKTLDKAVQGQAVKESPIVEGKESTAATERGTKIETSFAVVDVNDLSVSHDTSLNVNNDYPAELQPRQRERMASQIQVDNIINRLNPEFLGESPKASEGAPIVGKDFVVESGNGRVIALKKGYEGGHKNIEAYRQWLSDNADRFGISRENIKKVDNPVLVRIRESDVDRNRFVREANEQSVAAMGASEQAKADEVSLTPDLMAMFEPSDTGEINTARNRPFVRSFLTKMIPVSEMGRYLDSEGNLSQEGVRRVSNAIFAKAYGNAAVIEKFSESTDNNVKAIANVMVGAGPKFAAMQDGISKGELHDFNISNDIAQAIKKLSHLREIGQSFSNYLEQGALFDDGITPLAKDIIGIFDYYKRSPKKLKEIFDNYVEAVNLLGSPKQMALLQGQEMPAKAEILQASIRKMEVGKNVQDSLFKDKDAAGYEGVSAVERGKEAGTGSRESEAKNRESELGDVSLDVGRKGKISPEKIADIVAEIERIAAPGTMVSVKDKITLGEKHRDGLRRWGMGDLDADVEIAGTHQKVSFNGRDLSSLIELSLNYMNPTTPHHEAFHSVQELLLSEEEKRRIEERFPDREGMSSRERQAEAFARYANGKKSYPVWVRDIFERIREFLERLRSFVQGKGWASAADVRDIFERAYSGEMRERTGRGGDAGNLDLDIARLEGRIFGDDLWKARKEALVWARENLQGKSFRNGDTGWDIRVSKLGLTKAISGDRAFPLDHIEMVRVIPDLLQKAKLEESHPDKKGDATIRQIHRFYAPLEIDDKLYNVKLTIKEFSDGKVFYDHSLTKIERAAGNARHMPEGRDVSGSTATPMKNILSSDEDVKDDVDLDISFSIDKAREQAGKADKTLLKSLFTKKRDIQDIKIDNAEVEKRMTGARGILKRNYLDTAKDLFNRTVRHFPYLRGKVDGEVIEILRQAEAIPEYSRFVAARYLQDIVSDLAPNQYKAFSRYIIIEDLLKDVENGLYGASETKTLPFGFKSETEIREAFKQYQDVMDGTPAIKQAYEKRQQFMGVLKRVLVNNGLLHEATLKDDRYFHHQVLEYMTLKDFAGTGTSSGDVRTHAKGWQKARIGSDKDYNTEYAQAEFEVVSQAIGQLKTKETLERIEEAADISARLKKESKGKVVENWKELIPDGYVLWQPQKGRYFYNALSITERTLDAVVSGEIDSASLPDEVKNILAVGQMRRQLVIPKGVAKTLDNFRKFEDENLLGHVSEKVNTAWKKWTLINPLRVVKYNLNNTSGDLDVAIAYDPKILKYAYQVVKDRQLWRYLKGKKVSISIKKELDNAMAKGILSSGLSVQEIPDISEAEFMRAIEGRGDNVFKKWLWDKPKDFTNFRENILRLAAYRYFKDELVKGKRLYAASNKAEVDDLTNLDDKAAKLSRELIGDYGNLSQGGMWLRRHMIPFWSFMEINAPRYIRLLKNLPSDEQGGPAGRSALILAKKGGMFYLKTHLIMGMVMLWNALRFPDEDDELRKSGKRNHLILGRGEDGNIISLRFQGALGEALDWLNLEEYPKDFIDIMQGKKSWEKVFEEIYKSPVNKLVGGAMPVVKTIGEIATGRSLYPDVFNPKPIRDKVEHAARLWSMDMPYRHAAGKPVKEGVIEDMAKTLLFYKTDPKDASHHYMMGKVIDFMEKYGEEKPVILPAEKSNALYYYKQAVRYGDEEAAKKYIVRYFELGGTEEGFEKSIKKHDPLKMLPKDLRGKFISSLDEEDMRLLNRIVRQAAEDGGKQIFGVRKYADEIAGVLK